MCVLQVACAEPRLPCLPLRRQWPAADGYSSLNRIPARIPARGQVGGNGDCDSPLQRASPVAHRPSPIAHLASSVLCAGRQDGRPRPVSSLQVPTCAGRAGAGQCHQSESWTTMGCWRKSTICPKLDDASRGKFERSTSTDKVSRGFGWAQQATPTADALPAGIRPVRCI